jgi:hypothetical protein
MEFQRVSLGDDRMTSIVAPVETSNEIHLARKAVHYTSFTLIPPLSSNYNDSRH